MASEQFPYNSHATRKQSPHRPAPCPRVPAATLTPGWPVPARSVLLGHTGGYYSSTLPHRTRLFCVMSPDKSHPFQTSCFHSLTTDQTNETKQNTTVSQIRGLKEKEHRRGGPAARKQARPPSFLPGPRLRLPPAGARLCFLVCLISGLSPGGTPSTSLGFHVAPSTFCAWQMLNKNWHDDKGRWVKLRKQAGEGKPLSLRFFFPSLIPSADPEARSACGCPLGLKRPSWSGPQLEGQTGEGTAPAPRAQERSAPHVCVSGDDAPPEMWTRPPEISKQAAIAGMSQGREKRWSQRPLA